VPNATLLPAAVDRIYPGLPREGSTRVVLAAREREHCGDSYTYDLDVLDTDGRLVERWQGLHLQAVRKQDGRGPWVPALLGPYLERQLAVAHPQVPRCVVEPDGGKRALGRDGRRKQTRLALSRLVGHPVVVRYRGDGKPEIAEDISISVSHSAGLTLAVALAGQVGCDLQLVADRTTADWRLLLDDEQLTLAQLIAVERNEEFSVAATRVWGGVECLRKVGRAVAGPVTLDDAGPDNWVLLRAGGAQITSFATHLRNEAAPVVLTILMEGGNESGSLLRIPAHR
jgi:enediyne polyketide synthase